MRKSSDRRIDVSGSDIDERGRLINKDIPEDARRNAKKGKKRKDERKAKLEKLAVDEKEVKKKRRKKRDVEEEPIKKSFLFFCC